MRTRRRGGRSWIAWVSALIAALAVMAAASAQPPGTGTSGKGGGSGTQTQMQTRAHTETPTQTGTEARVETRERNRLGGTEALGTVGGAPDPLRERARALNGPCPSLEAVLGVYLGDSGTPLWRRWYERSAGTSCPDVEAGLLGSLASGEPAGHLDRSRDRLRDPHHSRDHLRDGSCRLSDLDACPELQDHVRDYDHDYEDYDHDYEHEYLSPGPHGLAGPT